MSLGTAAAHDPAPTNRYLQLVVGIVCMIMIANLQYGWNLFVNPIDEQYHWGRASIQVAFSIFVVMETWLVPIEGWFVDRFGPKIVVMVGGGLVAIAWALDSIADSLSLLYTAAVVSGVGAGAVYGTCVGNALKWFGDRRGLAAGLTAGGFGVGAAATVVPIANFIGSHGYQSAFLWFGLGQGLVILVLSQFLVAPEPGQAPVATARRLSQSARQFTPVEVLRTPVFYVLYVMFVLVGAGGLMATAQLASVAADFGVAATPISVLGITATTLAMALVMDNVLNGLARPFFGWLSDQIGREITMFVVFTAGAFSLWALGQFGRSPVGFIVVSGLIYFTWGEIYSLFPATCTDTYGTRYAATNAGLLYTAKGTAALLVPLANVVMSESGGWQPVFTIAAAMDAIAAVLALLVLKPMRASHHAALAGLPRAA